MNSETFDPRYAHISQDGNTFQVLKQTTVENEDGTTTVIIDWDEAATGAVYEAYLATL